MNQPNIVVPFGPKAAAAVGLVVMGFCASGGPW